MISARVTRFAVAMVMAAAFVAGSSGTATAAMHGRKFQMPSGNIACGYYRGVLRCDIRSGLNPEPKRDCELDWTGLTLDADGKAGPQCAGDTVADPDAGTLEYGAKWKRDGVVCRSRRSGLRCHNRKDHGFFLSRDSWDTF
jgi:hypothetical protein